MQKGRRPTNFQGKTIGPFEVHEMVDGPFSCPSWSCRVNGRAMMVPASVLRAWVVAEQPKKARAKKPAVEVSK